MRRTVFGVGDRYGKTKHFPYLSPTPRIDDALNLPSLTAVPFIARDLCYLYTLLELETDMVNISVFNICLQLQKSKSVSFFILKFFT